MTAEEIDREIRELLEIVEADDVPWSEQQEAIHRIYSLLDIRFEMIGAARSAYTKKDFVKDFLFGMFIGGVALGTYFGMGALFEKLLEEK